MKRPQGFYWVKINRDEDDAVWEVMRWTGLAFYDTYDLKLSEDELTINEERIKTPDEK